MLIKMMEIMAIAKQITISVPIIIPRFEQGK
jgi:hypothetical protein